MTNSDNQRSENDVERAGDDVERAGDDVERAGDDWDGLSEIFERGDRILQFLQAMDLQVMGACRADERLKPLLKLNVSCDAAEDRLLAHLSQHFEPSEVGLLARCLCIPLVSIRVGKINKQETLLCPTAIRGNLNLTLLPTSDLRISFAGDDGRTERLITLSADSQCRDVVVEEINSDTSGRSFLLKVSDGDVFYFWCSEKSKLLGNELLMKMKDLLQKKPSLAELTGISNARLECFATHLRAYLGSCLSTTRALSAASSDTSDIFEFCRAAKSSSLTPSKPLRSRSIASQSYQISLSPRSGSFKEGSSRTLSTSLKSSYREKLRRRDIHQSSLGDNLFSASPFTADASMLPSQIYEAKDTKKEQFVTRNLSDSSESLLSPPFLCPGSQVNSLASSLLSPYYCWCPPVASTLQYTISPPQLSSLSSMESLPLPPLSSLLPVNRSMNMLTPPFENNDMPKLDFPPLFPDPLMRFPLSRSSTQQIATFTPLMCEPIVHIPVIDVCSSGPGYLVSAGSALSTTIPPLLPKLGNTLIPESDPDVEKGARETLRLLLNGSSQTNQQLMDVFPSVFTGADEMRSILAAGGRGLYSGVRDVGMLANSFANLELVSFEKLIGSEVAKKMDASQGSSVDEVGGLDVYRDSDFWSNLEDGSD